MFGQSICWKQSLNHEACGEKSMEKSFHTFWKSPSKPRQILTQHQHLYLLHSFNVALIP